MKKKLNGFTLMETVVVLLLSAIVIGIIIEGFGIFSFQHKKKSERRSQESGNVRFRKVFESDMFKSEKIFSRENTLTFLSDKEIKYVWSSEGVIRNYNNQNDTFKFKIDSFKFTSIDGHEGYEHLINKVEFVTSVEKEKLLTEISKTYDSFILVERDVNKYLQTKK